MFGDCSDNIFCKKYGKCLTKEERAKIKGRPNLHHDHHDKIVQDIVRRWCTKEVLQKYLNLRDTNFEESSNFLMISLYEKRLYSSSGLGYDLACHTVPLLLNKGGWYFFVELFKKLNIDVPSTMLNVLKQVEGQIATTAMRKVTNAYKKRTIVLKKIRSSQYKNHDRHGIETNKHKKKKKKKTPIIANSGEKRKRKCMECFRMLNQVVYTHCGGSKCPYYEQVMARKKRVKSVNEANKNEKEEV